MEHVCSSGFITFPLLLSVFICIELFFHNCVLVVYKSVLPSSKQNIPINNSYKDEVSLVEVVELSILFWCVPDPGVPNCALYHF